MFTKNEEVAAEVAWKTLYPQGLLCKTHVLLNEVYQQALLQAKKEPTEAKVAFVRRTRAPQPHDTSSPPPSPLRSSPLLSVLRHQTHSPRDRERERERSPQPHSIKSPPLSPRSKPPPPPPPRRRRHRPRRPIWCPRTRRWWSGNFVGRLLLDFLIFFFYSHVLTTPRHTTAINTSARRVSRHYHQIDRSRLPLSQIPRLTSSCCCLRCVALSLPPISADAVEA